VVVYEVANKNKTLAFIPMHHVGKPEFYEGVKKAIGQYKARGYTVYYEGTGWKSNMDSLTAGRYERKFRKMLGVYVDTTGYAHYFHEKGLFKNLVDQPRYYQLGIDSNDVNVDIRKYELVDAYEKKYGEIKLEPIDNALGLDQSYPRNLRLPRKKVMSIIIDHRNEFLASFIQNSAHKKIVVIYGEEHLKGTIRLLKQADSSWK
jgi:hypothetical protein